MQFVHNCDTADKLFRIDVAITLLRWMCAYFLATFIETHKLFATFSASAAKYNSKREKKQTLKKDQKW